MINLTKICTLTEYISAFLHHVPDNGKLLVMFAPHVGIDARGVVGALQRDGQTNVSNAVRN